MYGGVRFDNVNQNVGHDAAASWLSLWDRQGWRAFLELRVEGVKVSGLGFGQGKLLLEGIEIVPGWLHIQGVWSSLSR